MFKILRSIGWWPSMKGRRRKPKQQIRPSYKPTYATREPRILRRTSSDAIGTKIQSYKKQRRKLIATVSTILESDPKDISLDMLDQAYVKRIDLLEFESYSYEKALKILEDLRKEYTSKVERYLKRRKNPHFKDRLEVVARIYTAEIEKMERSLSRRPEAVYASAEHRRQTQAAIAKWDALQQKQNEISLERMRKVLKYEEQTCRSIFSLNEEYTVAKLLSLGYPKELVIRTRTFPVLKFCVLEPSEIAKLHPHDFVNRFEFKNLAQGQELALVELRAIYHASRGLERSISEENELRKAWRERLRGHLKTLIGLEELGELDPNESKALVLPPNVVEQEAELTMERLLKSRASEKDYRRLKLRLATKEQEVLSQMEERIHKALSSANTEHEAEKLRRRIARLNGNTRICKLKRDDLQASIDVLPEIQQKRFVSKMTLLTKEDPLYECLLQTMIGWDEDSDEQDVETEEPAEWKQQEVEHN